VVCLGFLPTTADPSKAASRTASSNIGAIIAGVVIACVVVVLVIVACVCLRHKKREERQNSSRGSKFSLVVFIFIFEW
jgi:hypothetical protein